MSTVTIHFSRSEGFCESSQLPEGELTLYCEPGVQLTYGELLSWNATPIARFINGEWHAVGHDRAPFSDISIYNA